MNYAQRGFTFVEIMIVIAVLAFLSLIVAIEYREVQPKARDLERTTDTKTIASALESYFQKNGIYPSVSALSADSASVSTLLNIPQKDVLLSPDPEDDNSIVPYSWGASSLDTRRYRYWTPSSVTCASSYTPQACGTFVLVMTKEVQQNGGTVAFCGRGINVNTSKAVIDDPTNGLSGFSSASCSNF